MGAYIVLTRVVPREAPTRAAPSLGGAPIVALVQSVRHGRAPSRHQTFCLEVGELNLGHCA